MFQLLRAVSTHDLVLHQAPAMVTSFAVASAWYRFGSFALECLAFLATWFVLDLVITGLRRPGGRRRHGSVGGPDERSPAA